MIADVRAGLGMPDAEALITQLRHDHPVEAGILLAKLRAKQNRLDEAADLLEQVAVQLRQDPWPPLRFKQEVFGLVERLSATSAARNARLQRAISQPFAVDALSDLRLKIVASMALRLDD